MSEKSHETAIQPFAAPPGRLVAILRTAQITPVAPQRLPAMSGVADNETQGR